MTENPRISGEFGSVRVTAPWTTGLLVVGTGASSELLPDLDDIFREAPEGSGLVFVAVPYAGPVLNEDLRPTREPDAARPFKPVLDGCTAPPDNLYVEPAGSGHLLCDDAVYVVGQRPSYWSAGLLYPRFRSIADERAWTASGRLAAGEGLDGTAGLRAVRERTGVVLLLDRVEREQDGTNRCATAQGTIEVVLRVRGIVSGIVEVYRPCVGGRAGRIVDSYCRSSLHLSRNSSSTDTMSTRQRVGELQTVGARRNSLGGNQQEAPGFLVNEDLRVVYVYSGGERYLRASDSDSVPTVMDVLPEQLQVKLREALVRVLHEGRSVECWVHRVADAAHHRDLAVIVRPVPDELTTATCAQVILEELPEFAKTLDLPRSRCEPVETERRDRATASPAMPGRANAGKGSGLPGSGGSSDSESLEMIVTGDDVASWGEWLLWQSDQQFRAMADRAPVLVWMSDKDKRGTYFNRAWLDFTGRTLEEELGHGWFESVHPEDRGEPLEACRQAIVERRPFRAQFRLRRHDGAYRWMLDTGIPRFLPDGSFSGYIGTCIDITEQKEAADELRQRLRQQAVVAELGMRALENPDLQELMDEAARRVTETLGVAYCKVLELMPDGDRLLLKAGMGWKDGSIGRVTLGADKGSQAGFSLRMRAPVIVHDLREETRFASPTFLLEHGVVSGVSVLILAGDRPYGVLGVHTTEKRHFSTHDAHFLQAVANILGAAVRQRRAEGALHRTLAKFRRAVVNAPFPVCIHADDGEILQLSRAWTDLSGYAPDEIPTVATWTEKAYGERKEEITRGIHELYELEDHRDEGEFVITTKWGEQRTWSFRSAPLGTDARGRRLVVTIAADVTQRKQAEVALRRAKEAAEAADQAKSAFIAHISHDLRTPLTSILGFAELLDKNPHKLEIYQERIIKSAERLKATINAVLDFVRLEGRAVQLHPEPLNVGAILADVTDDFELAAIEKGLSLRRDIPEDTVWADLDRVALERVLTHLIDNAIKFTDEGHVGVSLRAGEAHVEIEVRDTGIGISEEFLPRIFERFEQESSGDTRSYEGSGLGLTISRQLVEAMGGHILVESRKGVGSTFTVRLPRLLPEEDIVPGGVRSERATDDTQQILRPRLLVVEDNDDTREMLGMLLEEEYEVVMVGTVSEAMQAVHGTVFDVLLIDIHLGPESSGIDLLRMIREVPGYEKVPAVACTAYAMPAEHRRFRQAGFDAYVPKPFTHAEITSALERILDQ